MPKLFFSRSARVLVASTILTAMPALADQPSLAQSQQLLPALTVTAGKDSLVAPSATQAEVELNRIPGGVALVPAEKYSDSHAVTVKDMLDYTPGVLAQPRINEESRLSIRGSGLSRTYHLRGITLMQDGIPITLADGSGDFQDIDPLAFRYVEVYKGANALQTGNNSLGGAVNFVTPTGYDADKLLLRAEAGSFNSYREQISSGQVIGNTDYFFSASNVQSDGYRDFSDQNNSRFFANIGQRLSDSLETRLYVTFGDLNQELPGNLTKSQLERDPKQANGYYKSNNWQRDYTVTRIASKTTWQGENTVVNGGVYTTQKDLFHPIYQIIDEQDSDYGAFLNGTLTGTIAGKKNELTLGGNVLTGTSDNKHYVNVKGGYGSLLSHGKEKADTDTLYLENRFYAKPNLALIAGSAFTYANRDLNDRFLSDGDQSGEKNYYGASPKIGALWEVVPDVQLFSNLSRAYEPPTFSELEQRLPGVTALTNIDAQKSTTLELGSRGKGALAGQRYSWDVSIYRSWLQDELMMYSVAPGQSGVMNASHTIHQGLELGGEVVLLENLFTHEKGDSSKSDKDSLTLHAAYTYNDFTFDKDASWGDNRIPGAPKHYIRAELRYDNPLGFYVAPNIEAVPEGYAVDMQNTLFTDAYAIFGLKAGVDITPHATLFIDVRNLADKKYAATTDVITAPTASNIAVFTPGDGRSIYAGVTYKF